MDGYLKNTPADLVKLNSEIEAIKLAKELSRLLQRLNGEVRDIVCCVEIRKGNFQFVEADNFIPANNFEYSKLLIHSLS